MEEKQRCCVCGCHRYELSLRGMSPGEHGKTNYNPFVTHRICRSSCPYCGRDCVDEYRDDGCPKELEFCHANSLCDVGD